MNLAEADRRPAPGGKAHPVDFNHPGFSTLFDYWQSVRRGPAIPHASDFDLLELAGWLPDIVILDVVNQECAMTRFTGTAVAERLGMDPTGQNVLTIQAKSSFDQAARAYQSIANLPCGALARYCSVYSSGREATARSLYLPLKPPSGEAPRLIAMSMREDGGTVYAETIERTMTGTRILSLDWLDLGFGVPAKF
ncbi:MAG: PAS domain-containing protein [Parvibaculum sp.]|jgi:hypothetical protein|uniref:PAS domain-containing protein n=1 Tax=Parvibaculum sp. TaxID=2024848 RepID=UPI0028467DDF|nr:PAS domain-containing protein [Parvibaculum sp.]MDR3499607.1 PAS domain-containing protein [Parvibaculum sp.]